MLVIAGTITLDPSRIEAAKKAAITMMAATRKEPGNISYAFTHSFEDDAVVHIFEEWESQHALDFHFKSPHMADFQKTLGGLGIQNMAVQKYAIESVGPLG